MDTQTIIILLIAFIVASPVIFYMAGRLSTRHELEHFSDDVYKAVAKQEAKKGKSSPKKDSLRA